MSSLPADKPNAHPSRAWRKAIGYLKPPGHLTYFPWARFVRHYSLRKLTKDANSGLNAALLSFPQGIAYALIAGLPIAFGIYASVLAALIGALLSRSPFAALGPTNSTSVLLMSTFAMLSMNEAERIATLPILLIMVAFILIAGAYLKMGSLIHYVSRSVMTGYVTASAALIVANQAWHVLGLHVDTPSTTFYQVIRNTILHIQEVQWTTMLLGGVTAFIYFVINRNFKRLPNIGITLILSSLIGWGFTYMGWPLTFTEPIDLSNWSISLPSLDFPSLSRLASAALAIALLCLLESASIGKSLAARSGQAFDINQEMFALGVANLGCSLCSGLPASTSPTRSTLAWKLGANSPLNNAFCAFFCLLIASTLGPLTAHIPIVTLAVLIMIVGCSLIDKHVIRVVLRSTPSDAVVFATTFLAGLLFPLDMAVYFGVVTSIALFLRTAASPEMVEYTFDELGQLTQMDSQHPRLDLGISIVHVEGNLFFGAAELFHDQIRRVCDDKNLKVVILKMRNAYHLDATSVLALEDLVSYMKENERTLLISEVKGNVLKLFKHSGLMDVIGKDHVFADSLHNPTLSTARALRKAQEIIGNRATRISIYTGTKELEHANTHPPFDIPSSPKPDASSPAPAS